MRLGRRRPRVSSTSLCFFSVDLLKQLLFNQRPQVKYHDIHHWFPESNYGQYIMLWDRLMGSFKPYPTQTKGA